MPLKLEFSTHKYPFIVHQMLVHQSKLVGLAFEINKIQGLNIMARIKQTSPFLSLQKYSLELPLMAKDLFSSLQLMIWQC